MARPEWTIEIDAPEATFGTLNPGFNADKLLLKVEGLADSVEYEKVEDTSITTDLAGWSPVQGLVSGTFDLTSPCGGIQTAAGDGVARGCAADQRTEAATPAWEAGSREKWPEAGSRQEWPAEADGRKVWSRRQGCQQRGPQEGAGLG